MVPWVERPVLDIDVCLPLERRYEHVPDEAVTAGRQLLDAVTTQIPRWARFLADLVRLRTRSRFHEEAVSVARFAGAGWRDVMLASVSYDLVMRFALGCSTVALPTPSGPVVGRNMDWMPEDLLARASYLVRVVRGGAFQFANAGWPGAIGVVTGLSARGFAVVLNAVRCEERQALTGYPVLLHLRRVLEHAADFDAALRLLSQQRLTSAALFTLVGSENRQRVVIERTPTRHALRWPREDEPLLVTNDYRLLFQPETHANGSIYQTTCDRYDALCRFFARHRPDREVGDSELLYILSDARVIQDITAQHILMRPRTGQVRLFVPRRLLPAA
jgi:hypothetical protein